MSADVCERCEGGGYEWFRVGESDDDWERRPCRDCDGTGMMSPPGSNP